MQLHEQVTTTWVRPTTKSFVIFLPGSDQLLSNFVKFFFWQFLTTKAYADQTNMIFIEVIPYWVMAKGKRKKYITFAPLSWDTQSSGE